MPTARLTQTQVEVLAALGEGLTYKEVAARRGCTASTVATHIANATRRLGVRDHREALRRCYEEGWLVDPVQARADALLGQPRAYAAEVARQTEQLAGVLAGSVDELVGAIERRDKLTVAQREYLAAFEGLLWARADDAKAAAREHMNRRLDVLLAQAGVRPRPRVQRDLVELLAATITKARERRST